MLLIPRTAEMAHALTSLLDYDLKRVLTNGRDQLLIHARGVLETDPKACSKTFAAKDD